MADICVVLEGTYPYVTGGVSAWIHDLILNLKDITFDIVTIVPNDQFAAEMKYKLPPNIKTVKCVPLNRTENSVKIKMSQGARKRFFEGLSEAFLEIENGNFAGFAMLIRLFKRYEPTLGDLFHTREGFKALDEIYRKYCPDSPFIDFFWTLRFLAAQLYNTICAMPPDSLCYHTISTGYAGLMASVFKIITGKKMLLTEHGIYTNERLLEIIDAKWIFDRNSDSVEVVKELPSLKKMWINLFTVIGKITYHFSDEIITLYRGNQKLQIKLGANPDKCRVIPNGIDLAKFHMKREKISEGPEYKVGFVGRIVPIKDVKTLLYSARLVADKLPQVKFLLKGPFEEDLEYFSECRTLVNILGLKETVFFLGPSSVHDFYKDLDLVVLSSVSEAQPLAVLEGNACSVPAVSTEVGCVRELLCGIDEEDVLLGPSGLVVPVKSPEALGDAIIKLLSDRDLNKRMGESGILRVNKYYNKEELIITYQNLYKSSME